MCLFDRFLPHNECKYNNVIWTKSVWYIYQKIAPYLLKPSFIQLGGEGCGGRVFFLLYKEQPQNFISSLRLYACKNITMETPEELYDYFMQIPSELKEEITRELNQDVNTYLLPKVKQMASECAIKTLKRLSVGIKKNTIDPGKKTHLILSLHGIS